MSGGGLRRRSREMALQLLFQTEFLASGELDPKQADGMARRFIQHFEVPADVSEYGTDLFVGIASRMEEIDSAIQSNSSHWKTSRMGLVDLSVMRIAVFEMKMMKPAIPPSVAINEAVELAKQFGSTESGAFVNGILDNLAKGIA